MEQSQPPGPSFPQGFTPRVLLHHVLQGKMGRIVTLSHYVTLFSSPHRTYQPLAQTKGFCLVAHGAGGPWVWNLVEMMFIFTHSDSCNCWLPHCLLPWRWSLWLLWRTWLLWWLVALIVTDKSGHSALIVTDSSGCSIHHFEGSGRSDGHWRDWSFCSCSNHPSSQNNLSTQERGKGVLFWTSLVQLKWMQSGRFVAKS